MEEEIFKKIVAKNLIKYRKINNLTQLELADKLNYSDKAVSKWERGESVPDAYTLTVIADFYGIKLNDLCYESDERPVPMKEQEKKKTHHLFITILSFGLVWLVATVVFAFLLLLSGGEIVDSWKSFIIAIPVCFIVLTIFAVKWANNLCKGLAVSGIVWGMAIMLNIMILNIDYSYIFYIIAIPLQILVIIWYIMKHFKKHS